jgi:hypothetical protein
VAVDATAARLMKIEPRKVKYLETAGEFLGNVSYDAIEQIGENLERYAQDFRVIGLSRDRTIFLPQRNSRLVQAAQKEEAGPLCGRPASFRSVFVSLQLALSSGGIISF